MKQDFVILLLWVVEDSEFYLCLSIEEKQEERARMENISMRGGYSWYKTVLPHMVVTYDLEHFKCQSVQLLSHVQLFVPWITARQASLSITNSWSSRKLVSIESMMPSKHLILCHPLIHLPSIFPRIRVFSKESVLHVRWPKYWSFRISSSNEYSGLISFRIYWLDLLAVQESLKSLLQHHSSKHQFISAQLSLWSNSDIHTWPQEKL